MIYNQIVTWTAFAILARFWCKPWRRVYFDTLLVLILILVLKLLFMFVLTLLLVLFFCCGIANAVFLPSYVDTIVMLLLTLVLVVICSCMMWRVLELRWLRSLCHHMLKRRISLQLRPSPQATIGTLTLRKHFPFLWNYANVDITVWNVVSISRIPM